MAAREAAGERRGSWRAAMQASDSGQPLLMNGSRTIDTDDFEAVEMRALDDPMNKTLENLDRSMRITVGLDFDNSCFTEETKQIDYVLAFEEEDDIPSPHGDETDAQKRAKRRRHFEENLRKMGLELTEVVTDPTVGRTHYILVHAPFGVLERQAQLLNVKLPVKKCDVESSGRLLVPGFLDNALNKTHLLDCDLDLKEQLEEPDYYTASYLPENRQKFVLWDRPEYMFPSAERSRLVYDLLVRARYRPHSKFMNDDEQYRVGIERLLGNGTYTGAYPLHQELRSRAEMAAEDQVTGRNQRELLYTCWASWRCWYKYQPLDLIKRYFGSKIGLYFAWLGYYTKTLYPAAFLGVLCFLFGLINYGDDTVSTEVCEDEHTLQCPICDSYCDFTPLKEACGKARMTYLFDNAFTVLFAALMSVWASLFLEGWKRYHAEVAWKWGLLDFAVEEDLVRPEFQYRVKTTKWNSVTKKHEPYLSGKKKCLNFLASGVTVLFFIFLVMGVVFGVVVYRALVLAALQKSDMDSGRAFMIVAVTAGILNLIVILIMNYVYYFLALILTRWECPRTQNDFDNSFTIKVFLFQFVNYYSSLFYVAFFKGIVSQTPAFLGSKNVTGGPMAIGGARLDGCDAVGCFTELVIQLGIIMCGRQFFSGFVELGYPFIMKLVRRWQFLVPKAKRERSEKEEKLGEIGAKRWEEDYFLSPTYEQWLFDEYLEMVIQFGFITLFVAAFPLAPLFALINNIMEIRMDAYKFLVSTQRPMPAQSRNIGIWLQILQLISTISVTINALVIAFTSDFVPRTYYKVIHGGNLTGYIEWSLSHFDTRAMENSSGMSIHPLDVTDCRFRGFRQMPCRLVDAALTSRFGGFDDPDHLRRDCDEDNAYAYSGDWWKVLALRLAFVVVFEHVVFVIKTIVDYLIPDVPTKIFVQQQREKYLQRKAALEDINSRNGSIREGKRSRTTRSSDVDAVAFQPGEFGHPYQRSAAGSDGSFATAPSEAEQTSAM